MNAIWPVVSSLVQCIHAESSSTLLHLVNNGNTVCPPEACINFLDLLVYLEDNVPSFIGSQTDRR